MCLLIVIFIFYIKQLLQANNGEQMQQQRGARSIDVITRLLGSSSGTVAGSSSSGSSGSVSISSATF